MNLLDEAKKKGYLTAYIDLYKAPSLRDLLFQYSKAVARSGETTLERMVILAKELLPGLRPKIEVGPDGTPSLSIDYAVADKDIGRMLEEIYDAPEALAKKRRKRFVIFDEFQEIQNLNGEKIEKAMRACLQHHKKVSYIFAGSKRHLLIDMVTNKNRAFYKMGKIINLKKLPRREFSDFLLKRFGQSGFIVDEGAMDRILDITEEYPYNAQFLCHELWDLNISRKRIIMEGIDDALETILSRESNAYLSLWDTLSLHQRQLLRGIAVGGGTSIFSKEYLQYYSLGANSSVQTLPDF